MPKTNNRLSNSDTVKLVSNVRNNLNEIKILKPFASNSDEECKAFLESLEVTTPDLSHIFGIAYENYIEGIIFKNRELNIDIHDEDLFMNLNFKDLNLVHIFAKYKVDITVSNDTIVINCFI